ncbi:MAG: CpsD/CapB family tyrosine-protein kinase [Candidatus Omnitrophica bacterium]|nr:CpsD/CapB family tyrosine-protein kinase [Candidatus Omnitrophota bacterium]
MSFLEFIKNIQDKQADALNMPSLPKEFILKSVVDSNLNNHIVAHFEPDSPLSEQYRRLRENLKTIRKKEKLQTIAVTSSTKEEGKSITSLNLAVTLAKDVDCKSVLLVDCDLRRGMLDVSLDLNLKVGLSDYLFLGADVESILYKTKIDKLTLMPRGKIANDPAELLGSNRMEALLEKIRKNFDYIILDTPPVIAVADSGIVCAQADGVIMVIRAGKTQRGIVKHSTELLEQSKAKLLGYVLTHIEYPIPEAIYRYV